MRPRIPWPFGRAVTWIRRARPLFVRRYVADLLLLGLVGITLYAWWYAMRWGVRNDVPVVMYPAHLMRTGQHVLYRDLIDMNQPGTFFVMGVLDAIAGTNDRWLRAADVAFMVATCALTPAAFRMPRRLPGYAASAVYAVFHLHDAGVDALQREVLVIFFVVASGAALRYRQPVLGGVLAGFAFFVKFHAIAFAIIFLAGQLEPATRWRTIRHWLFGIVLTATFLIGGLACFGAADDWWWLLRNYLPLYASLAAARGFEPDPWLRWVERVRYATTLEATQTLWAFPITFWIMLSVRRRAEWARPVAMAASFFMAAWMYPLPAGAFWTYHQTPAFFGAGVVLAVLIGARLRAMYGSGLERALIVCFGLYLAREGMNRWVENARLNEHATGINGTGTDVAAYLRANLPPGETVQPLDTVVGVVDGMWRADAPLATSFAYRFLFYHHADTPTIQTLRRRFVRELNETRPALVIESRGLSGLCGGTATTELFPELDALMQQHYVLEHATGYVEYYRRIDPWTDSPQ